MTKRAEREASGVLVPAHDAYLALKSATDTTLSPRASLLVFKVKRWSVAVLQCVVAAAWLTHLVWVAKGYFILRGLPSVVHVALGLAVAFLPGLRLLASAHGVARWLGYGLPLTAVVSLLGWN